MDSVLTKSLDCIRPQIKALQAYHVADANHLIKLDAMENPYGLPDDLMVQLQEKLAQVALNRYPDPQASVLHDKLIRLMQVPDDKAMILGNGSDELIQLLALAVAKPGATLLSFEPSFVMYQLIAQFVGLNYVGVPLTGDFKLDMRATCAAIARHQPALTFIAYPNNPTANCFDEKAIEQIIALAPGLVVLDEAYHPFAQKSFMSRLQQFDNLLVMRTVSKMGLAGLRLGLLCGHPDIIKQLDKVRLPYNINVLTQVCAELVLSHINVLDLQAKKIRESRADLMSAMAKITTVEIFPSDANFILFRVLNKSGDEVFDEIKQAGVLIKNMKASTGVLKNCLRVTVGKPAENQAFLNALVGRVG